MKHFFFFLLLAFLPLLSSCDFNKILADHDGGMIDVDSIGVANVDGSGFKMLAEGKNAHFTPDSKKIIFSNYNVGLYSVGVDGSGLTCIYKKKAIDNLLVSPNGMKIVFTSDSLKTIYMINTDGSGLTSLYESKYKKGLFRFSDDGSRLYFNENRHLYSIDLNGNSRLLFSDPSFSFAWEIEISPDEKNFIFFNYSGVSSNLFLKDLETQKDSMLVDCDYLNAFIAPAKYISQSTFLYVYNRTVYSYNLLSGEKQSFIKIPGTSDTYSDGSYYYSQDGQKIVYRSYFDKIEVADIDGTTRAVVKVPQSTSALGPYQISPDNKKVTFISIRQKSVD